MIGILRINTRDIFFFLLHIKHDLMVKLIDKHLLIV